MSKNIQIPETLWDNLVTWFGNDFDDLNEWETKELYNNIVSQMSQKMEKIALHEYYSIYKNKATSPEAKEVARQNYLNLRGIPQSFRW